MIYTVTFNPAIDYIININKLEKGKINFAEESNILPGGKGINVSTVLTNLEIENIALGFIGGFSGQEIKNRLKKLGVNTDFIEVEKGLTRINIKIKEKNIETAINCNSLIIEDKDIKEFLNKLKELTQVIIISDTFSQFAGPLMKKLGYPTIFCNSLVVADNGEIIDFKMRCEKSKYTTVKALQSIGYDTIASGDSHNDLGMIQASKAGFLFKSTDAIKAEYPEIPAYETYDELYDAIKKVITI